MSERILVDTDIIIDYLRGQPHAAGLLKEHAAEISFSVITFAEVLAGVLSNEEEKDVLALFGAFPLLPVSAEIASQAGRFMRTFRKSHGIELPDALIAGTCAHYKLELFTLNVKHYPMLKNLAPPYRKN